MEATHVIRNHSAHHFGASFNRSASELALKRSMGPAPAGILGVILIVVLILVLMGRF
jgi:Protein of unknown function (DUF3309)